VVSTRAQQDAVVWQQPSRLPNKQEERQQRAQKSKAAGDDDDIYGSGFAFKAMTRSWWIDPCHMAFAFVSFDLVSCFSSVLSFHIPPPLLEMRA
jgi:hypothetical protein